MRIMRLLYRRNKYLAQQTTGLFYRAAADICKHRTDVCETRTKHCQPGKDCTYDMSALSAQDGPSVSYVKQRKGSVLDSRAGLAEG